MFFKRHNHNIKAKKLPKRVHGYMRWTFDLLPEYLDMLRCFEYTGLFKGRHVIYVNIFSPDMARESHLSIKTNLEWEQHPEMLLYKGYIDSKERVYIADSRVPTTKVGAT